ncbi:MAG: hypothetical protein COT85_05775 [Chlamydiae bacterium CG10_big_fil_rev_8_21_14_0_10_42_34]|nr:MAG: hypothetical protein COT85_05775 [Chlamydiae bacterium CG10_big_fil_rev_8_21_14_0_10_42_34]
MKIFVKNVKKLSYVRREAEKEKRRENFLEAGWGSIDLRRIKDVLRFGALHGKNCTKRAND